MDRLVKGCTGTMFLQRSLAPDQGKAWEVLVGPVQNTHRGHLATLWSHQEGDQIPHPAGAEHCCQIDAVLDSKTRPWSSQRVKHGEVDDWRDDDGGHLRQVRCQEVPSRSITNNDKLQIKRG